MAMAIDPIVQAQIESDPGKPTVEAPMNAPPQRPQTAKKVASRFGHSFVARAIARTVPAIEMDAQANSWAFDGLTSPTKILARMQAKINEITNFRNTGEYVNCKPF